MQKIIIKQLVTKNNMAVRIKKPNNYIDLTSHTVLTDDCFSYVDFYLKSNPRKLKIKQNYLFYWEQARVFYKLSQSASYESKALPMYYCMLNAAKTYLLYKSTDVDNVINNFTRHGINESINNDTICKNLDDIFISRCQYGVFPEFSKMIDADFENIWWWKGKKTNKCFSIKELMYQLPFLHSAYTKTYKLSRNKELFIPIKSNTTPQFYKCTDNKTHLLVTLDSSYFKPNAVNIPADVLQSINPDFTQYDNCFSLLSNSTTNLRDLKKDYYRFRKDFCYIKADKRLWYMKKSKLLENGCLNDLICIFAITHRLSEIVRYKPEQLADLLKGKENWLIHEFLSLALDQFIDQIACEITGNEIMPTKNKA